MSSYHEWIRFKLINKGKIENKQRNFSFPSYEYEKISKKRPKKEKRTKDDMDEWSPYTADCRSLFLTPIN